jgi:hypothetical protein
MSDMTSLSHEYAAVADFAQEVNSAVVTIKKEQLGLGNPAAPKTDSIEEKRRALAVVIEDLMHRLMASGTGKTAKIIVPEDVLSRLEAKHQSQMAYFVEDLRAVFEALAKGLVLEERQVASLDEICDAADASASATFRRLRRR